MEQLKLTVGTANTVAAQTTTLLSNSSLINIQNFTQATVTNTQISWNLLSILLFTALYTFIVAFMYVHERLL